MSVIAFMLVAPLAITLFAALFAKINGDYSKKNTYGSYFLLGLFVYAAIMGLIILLP